ncbi:hypothetical protein BY996DRAFT_4579330 [Phakopsora pachyrhizi]|uniref:Uncharacterized protein n=1 Tax=Phakopsora pachyrhizi TaxID=170000 RepID=A0AAV0AKY2_PHAPC|nr:hypothetical protein BY996DRAFT_4579330 [Phakopsora pachyrhizi]CAH7668780.1 hypothetical protein PPACK8108_LOCUS3332 [Phakopsora pachyrhizi]
MTRRSQRPKNTTYIRLITERLPRPDQERETEDSEEDRVVHFEEADTSKFTSFCQTTLWIIAGSTLVGFAISALWWDPISCHASAGSGSDLTRFSESSNGKINLYTPSRSKTKIYLDDHGDENENESFDDKIEECNPFHQKGLLHYNSTDPGDNTWRPYRKDCKPSNLFGQLREELIYDSFHKDRADGKFEWLKGRTVVLIGDSIDRYHNLDFCQLLSRLPGSTEEDPIEVPNPQTQTFYIEADSPLSPPPWHFYPNEPLRPPEDWPKDDVKLFEFQTPIWDSGKVNANTTRPRVCLIPKYNFTMVNLFSWGLDPKDGGRLYANISGYFPPAEYRSRVDNILKPTLERLSVALENPLIKKPDLIEMGSGLWDLRSWSEEDFKIKGEKPNSYSDTAFTDLSNERLEWWKERQIKAIKHVSEAFDQAETPILWRTLHHVHRHYWVAFNRVFQLDQLARFNIENLKKVDPILKKRLRLDEWGALMLGQEHHYRDVLHVGALPGGALWGDVMLWELKRAVEKRGYSHYSP